jgi:hypothetical protein
MKKLFIALCTSLISVCLSAQSISLVKGIDNAKVVVEGEKFVGNDYMYGYVEAGKDIVPYIQLIYERTLWKSLGLHTEFRTDFYQNYYFIGPVWSFIFEDGAIMVEPLCRYENKQVYWQGSVVWSFDKKWHDFYGYADIWGQASRPMFYSEFRWHAKLNQHIGLGVIANVMYFDKFDFVPNISLRYKF